MEETNFFNVFTGISGDIKNDINDSEPIFTGSRSDEHAVFRLQDLLSSEAANEPVEKNAMARKCIRLIKQKPCVSCGRCKGLLVK